MKYNALIFDLDGTLTDSGPGIKKAVAYALSHMDLPVPEEDKLGVFVGPPLKDTFPKFGVPEERVDEAIALFREYYLDKGIFDNTVYPGTVEFLERMKKEGRQLYVATTKPQAAAELVLNHFGLMPYFTAVAGATADHTREKKEDIIAYLKTLASVSGTELMIGDTVLDVTGSAMHGIPCMGVDWGYGNLDDMRRAGVIGIVSSWNELVKFLDE